VKFIKERIGKIYRKWFILIVLLWVLFVMYPNPANLVVSIKRVFAPEIDAAAVAQLASELSDDPAEIERQVKQRIPYSYDWEVHGMPWYFPTAQEILERGKGDCKARALVLASVLEAKDITYSLNASITHMWVDYESKVATASENQNVSYYQQDPETGQRSFKLPSISTTQIKVAWEDGFWSVMPLLKKILLLAGLPALFIVRFTWLRKKRGRQSDDFDTNQLP
jgi:hypothetical protein